jgi:hypothetical protein
MFDLEIARVRSIPMALQRGPRGSIIHLNLPPTPLCVFHQSSVVSRLSGLSFRPSSKILEDRVAPNRLLRIKLFVSMAPVSSNEE